MVNTTMKNLGTQRSVIRELFEYGKKRSAEIGADKVFDFSLGNPSVPAPDCVNETIKMLVDTQDSVLLHGYTSAQGDAKVRQTLADYITKTHGTKVSAEKLYMTVGAAASLTITLNALIESPDDEIIAVTPFFPEYRVFVNAAGGKLVTVASEDLTFQLNPEKLRAAVTANTKAVIINSPNNPSGVVLSESTIMSISNVLREASKKYGKPIILIADEPYRELVYDNIKVPYIPNYYNNTVVCYSYSKSLSLPGERIGYILVPDSCEFGDDIYAAVCGAGRALGYVCAPSLFQRVAALCAGSTGDVTAYKRNRDILYKGLTEAGFSCVKPDGAFYLFVKSPESDAVVFCEKAKKHELLIVPADSFGTPGYVRIAYCVAQNTIENSLPAFRALAKEYNL